MTALRDAHSGELAEVRRSARSGAVTLAGAVVNGICGFVLTTVIVRAFGATGSGALFTAIGLVSIAGAVCCVGADTGMLWALPRRRPDVNADGGRLLIVALLPALLLAVAVAAAGMLAAGPISGLLFDRSGAAGTALVRLAAIGVPVTVAMTILLAAVRTVRPITSYVAVQYLLVPIARPAFVGVAVLTGGGIVAGFGGWLLPVAVAALIATALVVRPIGLTAGTALRPSATQWRTFWSFALPRAASAAIDASSMWVGVLLTAALAGQGQAGVFAAVGRYALAGLLVMQGLRIAVAPQLSRLLHQHNHRSAAVVYRRTTVWIVAVSWPGYILLGAFGPAFLHLFGAQFRVGATALAVLAGGMLINVGVGLVQTVLLMSGNSRGHLAATACGLTVNVSACVIGVPRLGALGAAIAWAAGIVIENVIAAAVARRTLGEPLTTPPMIRLAAVVSAGTALACLAGLVLAGRGVAGLAVALAVLAVEVGMLLASARVRAGLREARDLLRSETAGGEKPS